MAFPQSLQKLAEWPVHAMKEAKRLASEGDGQPLLLNAAKLRVSTHFSGMLSAETALRALEYNSGGLLQFDMTSTCDLRTKDSWAL